MSKNNTEILVLPATLSHLNTISNPGRSGQRNTLYCCDDPAEMAEALCLGRLEPEAAVFFKAHLETCHSCGQVYEETVEFVDAICGAAKWLESGDSSKAN
jgi:hypothetical protein